MSDRPISDLLPNVTADLDDGEIVLDGMVLMRVINPTSDGGNEIDPGTRCQCGQYQIGCQPIESLEYHYASNCGVAW